MCEKFNCLSKRLRTFEYLNVLIIAGYWQTDNNETKWCDDRKNVDRIMAVKAHVMAVLVAIVRKIGVTNGRRAFLCLNLLLSVPGYPDVFRGRCVNGEERSDTFEGYYTILLLSSEYAVNIIGRFSAFFWQSVVRGVLTIQLELACIL